MFAIFNMIFIYNSRNCLSLLDTYQQNGYSPDLQQQKLSKPFRHFLGKENSTIYNSRNCLSLLDFYYNPNKKPNLQQQKLSKPFRRTVSSSTVPAIYNSRNCLSLLDYALIDITQVIYNSRNCLSLLDSHIFCNVIHHLQQQKLSKPFRP